MESFQATSEQIEEVNEIYNKVRNRNVRLNRSRPKSFAYGAIYYWICSKGKNISLKEFTKEVSMSELTVGRIAKIISEVLNTPEIM